MAFSQDFSLFGYIDSSGAYKIWPVFQKASPFSDGFALVGEDIPTL